MLRQIVTENGILEGVPCSDPRITVFKGVPYAQAPVGELRWHSTVPHEQWKGIYKADHYAPMEIQRKIGLNLDDFYTKELHPTAAEYEMSEDCLYFNMWSPAKNEKDRLPIYVWFHGGGMQSGYSYEMEFDGEMMAKQGVIVVSVGYRLNVFGFLAHPELTREDPMGCHGNYGMEDVVFCIEWLKRNALSFGGDPNRITVGGQSGSAYGATVLAVSPKTKGLLSGIIMQSGGGLRGLGYNSKSVTLAQAEKHGKNFLNELGVHTISEARQCSAQDVFEAYCRMKVGFEYWSPCIDGCFLKEDPTFAMISDNHHRIPYLFGSTIGEGGNVFGGAAPKNRKELATLAYPVFNEDTESFLDYCNPHTKEDYEKLYFGDTFNCRTIAARAFAITQAKQGREGYCYIFNHDIPGEDYPGAYHGSDLWFVFGTLSKCWRPFNGKHYDLSRMTMKYWTNFIKYKNPNGFDQDGRELPRWESVKDSPSFVMEFSDTPAKETRELDKTATYRINYQLSKY